MRISGQYPPPSTALNMARCSTLPASTEAASITPLFAKLPSYHFCTIREISQEYMTKSLPSTIWKSSILESMAGILFQNT